MLVLRSIFATLVLLGMQLGLATAADYPLRPITIVVPFPAGGPADTQARIMAERMKVTLKQPVIIENIAGAGGSTGVGRVARAAPDGYTISYGYWGTHVLNGAIYPLPYDVVRDFAPVSLLGNNPLLILSKKSIPAQDLKGLIAWLKANPNRASEGTSGVGSASHMGGVLFQQLTGTRFQFVPYRGAALAMQDLISGQIDLMLDQVSSSLAHVRAGKVAVHAVTAKSRMVLAPEIPTVDEAGLPGMHISFWHGLFALKATPGDVIGKLNAAVVDALSDTAVRQRLGELGVEIPRREELTPEALSALQRAEIEKWWPIIRKAGIKAE